MLRGIVTTVVAMFSSLGLVACGNGVFPSTYRVTVDDPGNLLDPQAIRVSVFDFRQGDTRDWAERFAGTAAAGTAYVATVSTVESRLVFNDGPPNQLEAGLYLPGYRQTGWYRLSFKPKDGRELRFEAPFVAWDRYDSAGVPPLAVTVRPESQGRGWNLKVTVHLGTDRPDEEHAVPSADPLTLQLIAAAGKGDEAEVTRLLIKGARINGADNQGRTAVIAAALAGQIGVARYLVQNGADVNLKDQGGQSAYLISASEPGANDELLVVMLNGGARTGDTDSARDTALIRAARRTNIGAMRRLLTSGESVNHVNGAGRTALHELLLNARCTTDQLAGVQLLIQAGAGVNVALPGSGKRPLDLAREMGCAEIVRALAGVGATASAP